MVDCTVVVPWTDRPWVAGPLRLMLLALLDAAERHHTVEVLTVGQPLEPFGHLPASGNDVAKLRRMGLDAARGRAVAFIDSDDWHDPAAFATELTVHKETGAQVTWHRRVARFALHGRKVQFTELVDWPVNLVSVLWDVHLLRSVPWKPPAVVPSGKALDNDTAVWADTFAASKRRQELPGMRAVHLAHEDNISSQVAGGVWTRRAEYAHVGNLPTAAFLHAVRMANARETERV